MNLNYLNLKNYDRRVIIAAASSTKAQELRQRWPTLSQTKQPRARQVETRSQEEHYVSHREAKASSSPLFGWQTDKATSIRPVSIKHTNRDDPDYLVGELSFRWDSQNVWAEGHGLRERYKVTDEAWHLGTERALTGPAAWHGFAAWVSRWSLARADFLWNKYPEFAASCIQPRSNRFNRSWYSAPWKYIKDKRTDKFISLNWEAIEL